jgi:regulator of protease activity HflC (stomatin/prohibitin superfamily)
MVLMSLTIRLIIIVVAVIFFFFLIGIRIVRPTHRGLIETLGKYTGFANPGFHWVLVMIQRLYLVDIREQLVNAEPQVIITNDNLNATVDAQVYLITVCR